MTRSTSIAAYQNLVVSGKEETLKERILKTLKEIGPATQGQIGKYMDYSANNAASMLAKMRDNDLTVVELGEVVCPVTKETVIQWDVRKEGQEATPKQKKKPYSQLLAERNWLFNELLIRNREIKQQKEKIERQTKEIKDLKDELERIRGTLRQHSIIIGGPARRS